MSIEGNPMENRQYSEDEKKILREAVNLMDILAEARKNRTAVAESLEPYVRALEILGLKDVDENIDNFEISRLIHENQDKIRESAGE